VTGGDMTAQIVWSIFALILVGSSLMARRLPLGQSVKMALAWVAIFGGVYVLFLFRGEGAEIWNRIRGDIAGEAGQTVGRSLRIPQNEDGHFWVRADLNGTKVRFLIDSGATVTTISAETARAAGIEPMSGPAVMVETANGMVAAHPARIGSLKVGDITRTAEPVHITEGDTDTAVLGMTFLSRLKSWKVERGTLTLEP